jgi:hypothetical protein
MFSEFIFFVLSVYEGWLLHTGTGAKPESIHRKDKFFLFRPERMATSVTEVFFSGAFVR